MKADDINIIIDPEFQDLIPSLTQPELAGLEADITSNGCTDPLSLWEKPDGQLILVDGHHRFDICARHNLDFEVRRMHFENRDEVKVWMIHRQFNRRNLTSAQRADLVLILEPLLEQEAEERQLFGKAQEEGNLESRERSRSRAPQVRDQLAEQAGVSNKTIDSVKHLKEEAPDLLDKAKKGEISVAQADREMKKRRQLPADESDGPPPVTDGLNSVVDKPELETFFRPNDSLRREWETLRTDLLRIGKRFEGLLPAGFGQWCEPQKIEQDLKNLKHQVKFAIPFCICPTCKGKKCSTCRKTGWITEEVWERNFKAAHEDQERRRKGKQP